MSHGLTSEKIVLPGEDPAEFELLLKCLFEEHRPSTATEALLVGEIAQAHWRLERVRRRQDQAFESASLDAKLLSLLHRYATSYERSFYKSLETLKKLQRERLAQSEGDFVSQNKAQAAFLKIMQAFTPPKGTPNQLPLNPEEMAAAAATQ